MCDTGPQRDDPLYLFLDGLAERLRPGAKREAILCAWAITWDGRKVLLHLTPGTKDSTDCCKELLADLKRRGLKDPVLAVTDSAPGLIRAGEACLPTSLRQRGLAHYADLRIMPISVTDVRLAAGLAATRAA